jgi:alpha-glucosidase (family GH31 glycosyl hydrolase)
MDDTAQKQNNPIGKPLSQDGQAQIIDNYTDSPPEQKIIDSKPTPVASSLNKEIGVSTFTEVVRPSEEEIKLGVEVKNAGLVANTDKPKLDVVHEQIGVKVSAESTPVNIIPTGNITLPMSEEEADKTLKIKQSKFNVRENVGEFAGEYTEDSLPFFATLIKKIFKEMHRKVFGKKS